MGELKQRILAAVEGDLAAIETALGENLTPYLELVSQVAGHILFSGGKRLRPLLTVLSGRLCGYRGDYDKTLSTAIEYLHTATLIHDDLVDGARLRRGRIAAHQKWDGPTAVLVGDFLLARTMSIAAGTGELKVIRILAELTENMSQGEIHQLQRKGDVRLSEAEYLEVIRRKTAMLFEAACRVGAVIAGAGEALETALGDYGHHLGVAFQMADDLLDYTTDTAALGKEVGADLREGKLTLPVIHALRTAGAGDRRRMERIITDEGFSAADFEALRRLLEAHDGIGYTRRSAAGYIERAKAALEAFAPSPTREVLAQIADYALVRGA